MLEFSHIVVSFVKLRDEIVIWARKRTGVPVIRLSSVTAAEEFLKHHPMFAVGLFENYEVQELVLCDYDKRNMFNEHCFLLCVCVRVYWIGGLL